MFTDIFRFIPAILFPGLCFLNLNALFFFCLFSMIEFSLSPLTLGHFPLPMSSLKVTHLIRPTLTLANYLPTHTHTYIYTHTHINMYTYHIYLNSYFSINTLGSLVFLPPPTQEMTFTHLHFPSFLASPHSYQKSFPALLLGNSFKVS